MLKIVIYHREKDLNQPDYDYKPDILKDGLVPMNLNIPDETNIVTNADENYGTFQENIVQINENDDWNDNFIFLLLSYAYTYMKPNL